MSEIGTKDLLRYAPAYVARRIVQDGYKVTAYSDTWTGAALFADVSGFTPLSEKFAARGPEGAEGLSQLLNKYFGQLVDILNGHGADMAHFAGDAVLAFWPLEDASRLRDINQMAAQCAFRIQEEMGTFQGPGGEKLTLRVGIGVGKLYTMSLGGVFNRFECLVTGPAVLEASKAAAATIPGTTAAGERSWALLAPDATGEAIEGGYTRIGKLNRAITPEPLVYPELPEEAVAALMAVMPASIRRRLQVKQSAWLAELRRITVIFVSLPSLNEETSLEVAQAATEAMQEELYRFEASVNKLGADEKGVWLVGALGLPPMAHEDDELRAALAGLSLYNRLTKMGMECSVGVNAGTVFCGTVGNATRCEYSVFGDAVNLSARLMGAAHGGILCSESVYAKAAAKLDWEILDPIKVKGKTNPVGIFKPLREATKVAASTRPQMPMVGREAELGRARALFERVAEQKGGGIIAVEGQAGIGKSRMVSALVETAAALGLPTLMGAADAVQRTTPYFAFRPLFHKLFGLDGLPDAAAQRARVLEHLAFDPELVERAPLLEVVLALDFQDNETTKPMFGEARVDNTNDALVKVLARTAGAHPIVILVEDCHWLDSSSWALVARIAREVERSALVLATRPLPEAIPQRYAFLTDPGTDWIRLTPLGPEHSLQVVKQRLGVSELPAPVAEVLVARAQGNPFFTEEVAYALVATGQITVENGACTMAPGFAPGKVNLPDTVQGVVLSRIDRLDPRQQLTLKVASVVGRTFPYKIVEDVCPIAEDRSTQSQNLANLEEQQFVDEEAKDPERIYTFHHVITQEVAYQLMVGSQRQSLHRSVAEWYEKNHTDLSPYFPLLAKHWTAADKFDKAIEYLDRSGQAALRENANEEAVEFFTQALALDRAAGSPTSAYRRGCWERQLAEARYNLGNLASALEHYEAALELLGYPFPKGKAGWVLDLLRQMLRQAAHRWFPSWFKGTAGERAPAALEAARAYERLVQVRYLNNAKVETIHAAFTALNLAETVGDTPELARDYACLSVMCGLLMMHGAARRYAERGSEIARLVDQKSSSGYVAFLRGVYWVTVAEWELTERDLTEACAIQDRIGERRHWFESAFTLANGLSRQGDLARSAALAADIHEQGRRRTISQVETWGLSWHVWCQIAIDPAGPELRRLETLLTQVVETRTDIPLADQVLGQGLLALARWRLGDTARALAAAHGAEKIIATTSQIAHYLDAAYDGLAQVYFGVWATTSDAPMKAEMILRIEKVCTILKEFAMMYPFGTPRTAMARGRLAWMRGKPEKARAEWLRALADAERMKMPYEQAHAHELLASCGVDVEQHRKKAAESMAVVIAPERRARTGT